MLEWSYEQNDYPVAIRVPVEPLNSCGTEDKTDYSKINKSKVLEKGEKVAILGLGSFAGKAKEVKEALKQNTGINATLINPVYISGVDEELLESLKADHSIVVTLEDGILDGGFGEKVARFYGNSDMKVLNFGGKKEFTDRIPLEELYNRYHLTTGLIINDIKKALNMEKIHVHN